jgi:hypothetical protein
MTPPVIIILGASGDKMLEFWLRQNRNVGFHLVPFLEAAKARQVGVSLRVQLPFGAKFKATSHMFAFSRHKSTSHFRSNFGIPAISRTIYQTTQFVPSNRFMVVDLTELPENVGFELSGQYEFETNEITRLGFTTAQLIVKSFGAKFEFKDGAWHVSGVKNGGIELE